MNKLTVSLGERSYDVLVDDGLLAKAGEYLDLNRRVLLVTDAGIPTEYAARLSAQCELVEQVILPIGEENKTFASVQMILEKMVQARFSRKDCVVALGGGIVGDVAGFAASMYMRGVDFYNIPTTLLAQVDSSIGGKTAINFMEIKNIVGTFYQPKRVLIDPALLSTLPARQIANGMAEVIKMALTSDVALFSKLEQGEKEIMSDLIVSALQIKKSVVEQDETESGLRKLLNFGHTVGHGIEASFAHHGLYHGECVALGMLCMCNDVTRSRLVPLLQKWSLPTEYNGDLEAAYQAMLHDKKGNGDTVDIVTVSQIGQGEIHTVMTQELKAYLQVLQVAR